MAEKVREQFGVSFIRVLILFMRNPLLWLITSQSPHHHIPSHWILEFNIQILEEYRYSVHTNRQLPSLGLTHRSWSTFVGCSSNDSLIFRAFKVLFGSPGYIWCNCSLTGLCCCCQWWWKLILKCGLLSILVRENITSVSSQDGIEIPLLMLPRCFSVSGQRKISGPWMGDFLSHSAYCFGVPFLFFLPISVWLREALGCGFKENSWAGPFAMTSPFSFPASLFCSLFL